VAELIAVVATGLGTYLSRSLFILALAKRRIPPPVVVALEYVAPSVIGALIVAVLIGADGSVAIGAPELAAFAVGAVVARKTRNHIYTLLAGMVVYWVIRALI
jgi:branched-subunit amino acid transport protein